jgi:hypothetical protein
MALQIVEFFGHEPLREEARPYVEGKICPFIGSACIKPNHGACSVRQTTSEPIICCPNRLYADHYRILADIAREAFGPDAVLTRSEDARKLRHAGSLTGNEAVAFGHLWTGELSIPKPATKGGGGRSSFYVDWVIAKVNAAGELEAFTAVEVQTIDTTGSYREQSDAFFEFKPFTGGNGNGFSDAGMNWENVNKRILPQLIYKGHVLRREAQCSKGLFFVCPSQVYQKIKDRLGDNLLEYTIGNGTITFRAYDLGPLDPVTGQRGLVYKQQFITTIDQLAVAFTSPMNLPPQNVYAAAINTALV